MGRPKVIHTTKLFGGRETAEEVHRKHAWAGGRCYMCGDRVTAIKLSYAMSPVDLVAREPRITAMLLEQSEDGQLPVWLSKYGPMVWFWTEYACSTHQRYVEREAAKLPSYVLVEIDRGPGRDKTIVQVPQAHREN
jgi:hypothetical protein